jgi:hypothetical protein
MLVYLDMCCLKRPLDDQSQPRVRLEAEAVLSLLAAESAELQFVRSRALWLENTRNPLPSRAARVARWLGDPPRVLDPAALEARTAGLIAAGFGNFDALHIASAEAAGADCLATCDDRLDAAARRGASEVRVRVANVIDVAREVLQ